MADDALSKDPLRRITLAVAALVIGSLMAWVATTTQQSAVSVSNQGIEIRNMTRDIERLEQRVDRLERPPTPGVR